MKKKNLFVLLYISGILIYNSCAPAYIPNVINAPMFSNKGEIQASVHLGFSGANPQLAYAVTDHIGIMANGSFLNVKSDESSAADFNHKSSFFELGSGYYSAFGSRFKFGAYGGAGLGKINAEYENSFWTSGVDVNCTRFFFQPTIGMTSKIFDLGVSTRLVAVSFGQNSEKNTGIMFEPALTAKLGWDYIKVVGQVGLSYPINGDDINFVYQPGLFSLGLQGNFGKVFK
jgi:hypothetical protein